MAEKDFMDQAVSEWISGEQAVQTADTPPMVEPATNAVEPTSQTADQNPPVVEPQPQAFTPEVILQEFNKLSGMNFESVDNVKAFAESVSKLPEIEEKAKVIPDLLNALDLIQNPMNYFTDETAFKVSQLAKDEKFKGKENIINEILRNDLNTLNDVRVIELASALNAKQGVRNPLRAELRGMNIDPDDIISDYDSVDDDTKDLLKIKADQYRDQLSKIGDSIKAPSFEGTNIEQMLAQRKAAKEDFEAKRSKIMPVAEGIINEVKELKLTNDFSFKLELSPDQVKSYSEELAEILASGQYDLSTDAGKTEVYGAIMDMFKSDFFDKAIAALVTHSTSKIEEDMRRKFNNEKPLEKNEPPADSRKDERDLMTRVAEQMVAWGK